MLGIGDDADQSLLEFTGMARPRDAKRERGVGLDLPVGVADEPEQDDVGRRVVDVAEHFQRGEADRARVVPRSPRDRDEALPAGYGAECGDGGRADDDAGVLGGGQERLERGRVAGAAERLRRGRPYRWVGIADARRDEFDASLRAGAADRSDGGAPDRGRLVLERLDERLVGHGGLAGQPEPEGGAPAELGVLLVLERPDKRLDRLARAQHGEYLDHLLPDRLGRVVGEPPREQGDGRYRPRDLERAGKVLADRARLELDNVADEHLGDLVGDLVPCADDGELLGARDEDAGEAEGRGLAEVRGI